MIIAVGFKVNNERAVRFRKWADLNADIDRIHAEIGRILEIKS
jgi:hypothetical protein